MKKRIKLRKSYGINGTDYQEATYATIGRHFRGLAGRLAGPSGITEENNAHRELNKFMSIFKESKIEPGTPHRAEVMANPGQVFRGFGLDAGTEMELTARLQQVESEMKSDFDIRVKARELILEHSQKWPNGSGRAILERIQDYLKHKLSQRPELNKGQKVMKRRIKLHKSEKMQELLVKGMTVPGCPDCKLVVLSQDESSKRIGVEGSVAALNATSAFEGITWQAKKTMTPNADNAPNCPKCGKGMLYLESVGKANGSLVVSGTDIQYKKSLAYEETLEILSK